MTFDQLITQQIAAELRLLFLMARLRAQREAA